MTSIIFTTATNVNTGSCASSQRLIAKWILHRLPATKNMLPLWALIRRYESSMNETLLILMSYTREVNIKGQV
jgi:hypothetical protein